MTLNGEASTQKLWRMQSTLSLPILTGVIAPNRVLSILLITFLNEPKLNGFKYFYLIGIILFTINHLFARS